MAAPHPPTLRAPDLRRRNELLLAASLGAAEIAAVLILTHWQPERRPLDVLAVGLLALGAAALVIRRQHLILTLGLTYGATLAYWLLNYPRGPVFLSMMVVIFTAATSGRRGLAWVSLLSGFVSFLWLPYWLGQGQEPETPAIFGLAGWMLVLAASAEVVRIRRERELAAVAAGLTNAEIAEWLVMSPATAKTHVSRAMVKLGARDRAQLVVMAYESGLVRPGGPA